MMLTELAPKSRRSRLRGATRCAALAALALGSAGLLVSAPVVAAGPTTFTNSTAITIATDTPAPPTPATPYPSTITVSGMAGPVSDVDVRLNGFSHGVANDVDLLLVGPSGANLVLLSDPGGPNTLVGANNATVTFDDSAPAGVPQSGTISGTVRYRPTDTDAGEPGADSFPAPAPALGSATTLATFTGTNPNGTWRLYVVDDATGDLGSIAGGWSVTITTSEVAASTTTALNSSPNPSTTGTSVTFTATVTSGAAPVTTGTVTFTEGATTLAANVPVNGSGQATFSTSALAEGSHVTTATFNGTPTLLTSSGTVTQVVNNATTTPDGDTWCNAGGITVPSSGTGTPYPSRITVSGAGTAISLLTVDLADVAHTTPFDLEVLLVGPTGQNLVLMSDAGGSTAATGVDLTFADSAAGPIPAAGPLSTGTFDPSDNDSDGADSPLPPPAPVASGATTLATFNATNPNGTWSLFVADDASGDSGSIAGGWCLNVSTAQPTSTALTASPSPSRLNQAVTFTATVTSGGVPVTAGTVTFQRGTTTLAANVAVNAQGRATFTTSSLVYALHVITATYNGATGFDPSTSPRLLHLVDPFAPVARPTLSPPPNAAGWSNRDVTVNWNWLEHHSGLDPANCPGSTTSSGQGLLTVTATCFDLAGNQGTGSQPVQVDKAAPTMTITSPAPGGFSQGATVIADYSCADVLSGVVSCTGPVNDGARINTSTPGVHWFFVTGCDLAGNQRNAVVAYRVDGVVGGGVNVAPVLRQPACGPLDYVEGAPPAVIAPTLTAADVDSANLVRATVDIGAGYVAGQDVLSLGTNPQNGISAAFNATTGTLTLTGTATVANYQAALRDVRFANTSPDATAGTRTVTFRVDDGPGPNDLSNTVTRNVIVTPV